MNEEVAQAKTDVDEFIRRLKLYFNSPTLTREMCLALFDKLIIGGKETVTGLFDWEESNRLIAKIS